MQLTLCGVAVTIATTTTTGKLKWNVAGSEKGRAAYMNVQISTKLKLLNVWFYNRKLKYCNCMTSVHSVGHPLGDGYECVPGIKKL